MICSQKKREGVEEHVAVVTCSMMVETGSPTSWYVGLLLPTDLRNVRSLYFKPFWKKQLFYPLACLQFSLGQICRPLIQWWELSRIWASDLCGSCWWLSPFAPYEKFPLHGLSCSKMKHTKKCTPRSADTLEVRLQVTVFRNYGILHQQASKKLKVSVLTCFFFILTIFH